MGALCCSRPEGTFLGSTLLANQVKSPEGLACPWLFPAPGSQCEEGRGLQKSSTQPLCPVRRKAPPGTVSLGRPKVTRVIPRE